MREASWSAAVLRLSQNSFSHHQKTPPESSKRAITQMGAKNFRVERFLKLLRQSLLCRFGSKFPIRRNRSTVPAREWAKKLTGSFSSNRRQELSCCMPQMLLSWHGIYPFNAKALRERANKQFCCAEFLVVLASLRDLPPLC